MYVVKLNPCPKCGGKPILRTRDIKWLADCTIQCSKCDMFVHCQTQEGAIEEWNQKGVGIKDDGE